MSAYYSTLPRLTRMPMSAWYQMRCSLHPLPKMSARSPAIPLMLLLPIPEGHLPGWKGSAVRIVPFSQKWWVCNTAPCLAWWGSCCNLILDAAAMARSLAVFCALIFLQFHPFSNSARSPAIPGLFRFQLTQIMYPPGGGSKSQYPSSPKETSLYHGSLPLSMSQPLLVRYWIRRLRQGLRAALIASISWRCLAHACCCCCRLARPWCVLCHRPTLFAIPCCHHGINFPESWNSILQQAHGDHTCAMDRRSSRRWH